MLKTLHYYIGRDLVKVTLLAVVAFTLVMTVFGLIEPLRKQEGMAADQIMQLFGCTLPIMLSFTLPVSALFASTIVYGRFGQENELLACRASGISTMNVLRPAIVLGVVVTAIALVLSNFVAPKMVASSKSALEKNIKGIVYSQLKKRGYVREGTYLIHGDYVDEAKDVIYGLVFADTKNPNDVKLMVASQAHLDFHNTEDSTYLRIHVINPRATRTGSSTVLMEESQDVMREIPNLVKEEASWMDWPKLLETADNPQMSMAISRSIDRIRRDVCHDLLANRVCEAILNNHTYLGLQRDVAVTGAAPVLEQYVIRANRAKVIYDDKANMRVYVSLWSDNNKPVVVEVRQNGKVVQTLSAPVATVEAKWSNLTETSEVVLSLDGTVEVKTGENREPHRRLGFEVGQLPIPAEIAADFEKITDDDIYKGNLATRNTNIQQKIELVRVSETRRLLNGIRAEMHSRVSYNMSCFLMVTLGAALGLIFRGGNFITAFTIAMVPGSIVIIMMLMGKTMLENPKVNEIWGLIAIWSGITVLLLANIFVYARLVRK